MVGIFDDISITRLGAILKAQKISANISYGSGGFCVVFSRYNEIGVGYAWDLEAAANKAMEILNKPKNESEEKTNPQIKSIIPKEKK